MLRPMKNVFRKWLVRYTSEYLSTTVIYLMDVFLSVVASGIVILFSIVLSTRTSSVISCSRGLFCRSWLRC